MSFISAQIKTATEGEQKRLTISVTWWLYREKHCGRQRYTLLYMLIKLLQRCDQVIKLYFKSILGTQVKSRVKTSNSEVKSRLKTGISLQYFILYKPPLHAHSQLYLTSAFVFRASGQLLRQL